MGPLRKEVLSTFLCCRAEWHLRVEENTMIFLGPVIRAKVGLATRFFVLFFALNLPRVRLRFKGSGRAPISKVYGGTFVSLSAFGVEFLETCMFHQGAK